MRNIDEAIQYFEDAIKESDEIIAECSPTLQAELTEQKGHFEVALGVMQKSRWIPVSERLPEEDDVVLMYELGVKLAVNIFDEMDDVTHWMPLPDPPKGG